MALSPSTSSEHIIQNSSYVKINNSGLEKLSTEIAKAFATGSYGVESWTSEELTPNTPNDRAIEWIFVTDLLNFSFWTELGSAKYEVAFSGKVHTGYWALCAAVNRAIEEGFDLLDANFYQHITESQLRHIFRSISGVEIPLFNERLCILRDAGKTLVRRFNGFFKNVVQQCEGSCLKLLDLLCENFPSFRDTAYFEGKHVSFLKRAQILVGDLWSCFGGQGLGAFCDIDKITAFADYRVPQVLFYHGAISYSDELLSTLSRGEHIPNGNQMEVEIRAATIFAVQLLVSQVKAQLISMNQTNTICNAILVDNYLWTFRRDHAREIDATAPMHKTRCIFY